MRYVTHNQRHTKATAAPKWVILVVPGASNERMHSTSRFRYVINDCSAIIDDMASIVIRNLDEATKRKLKIRAAMNGRSMEQEAREILKGALARAAKKKANLAEHIRDIFSPLGGVDLERLPREAIRDPEWLAQRE